MNHEFVFDGYLSNQTTFLLFVFDGWFLGTEVEVVTPGLQGVGGAQDVFFGGSSDFEDIEKEEEEEIVAFVNAFMRCL